VAKAAAQAATNVTRVAPEAAVIVRAGRVPIVVRVRKARRATTVRVPTRALHRSSLASLGWAPMVSRCRRAASGRASRSGPMRTGSGPTESRGIPSVVRSVRPSAPTK